MDNLNSSQPVVEAKSTIQGPEREDSDEFYMGKETLLLVDDENMILGVGSEMLKELGYVVLIARNGKEAVEIYRTNQGKINMVILDMIMPGMGGGETYDKIKEINPNIKVFLTSGYDIYGESN